MPHSLPQSSLASSSRDDVSIWPKKIAVVLTLLKHRGAHDVRLMTAIVTVDNITPAIDEWLRRQTVVHVGKKGVAYLVG